jgi:hypothetical protein
MDCLPVTNASNSDAIAMASTLSCLDSAKAANAQVLFPMSEHRGLENETLGGLSIPLDQARRSRP